jgi:ataxia telangiectasia mutated family protein
VTGEVVHIDFGIVFEQGKGLGTPETVPFRLTRDIVDAMGLTQTEGSFRRSCEEVLRVLRDNALQIMTILEVVIHDPLYKWSLSPLQARQKQNTLPDFQNDLDVANMGGGNNPNLVQNANATFGAKSTLGGSFGKSAAERTLLRVLHKLHGQEDPSSGEALSVEGHVDLLINEARSEHNLSKLFPGWAPWL